MRHQIIPAKILLVGDFPSAYDLKVGSCFNGPAGEELADILSILDLPRHKLALTNVFTERPEGGNIDAWAVPRKGLNALVDRGLPWAVIPCKKGVVAPCYVQNALKRLHGEIDAVNPNIIVAFGNTALAALTGQTGLTNFRGALQFFGKRKVLPTYSPYGVLKNYEWKAVVVMDLNKAKAEGEYPEARLRNRKLYICETLGDLSLAKNTLKHATHISTDIETRSKQITCIGFAPSPDECYVVPFWDKKGSFWKTVEEEAEAYRTVREICGGPSVKIFQNGMYDLTYLDLYKIKVANFTQDTMLFHHALYPQLPKALGFLGSLYANERSWKRWRVRGDENLKKED